MTGKVDFGKRCACLRDVDLEAATAHVGRGKNGEPRVLPLTAQVVAELRRHGGPHPEALVLSRYDPAKAAQFSTAWRRAATSSAHRKRENGEDVHVPIG